MKIFEFESASEPGIKHKTTLLDSGRVTCTCKGARNGRDCWHIKSVQAEQEMHTSPALVLPFEPADSRPAPLGFIEPMCASALDDDKTIADYQKHDWILEEKYDGHRMIIRVHRAAATTEGLATAWSRQGNVRVLPPHIQERMQHLPDGIYDGELYLPGGTSTDVTRKDKQHLLKLVIFDLLMASNVSAMELENLRRRRALELAIIKLDPLNNSVSMAPQYSVTEDGLQKIWDRGGEGAIIKWQGTVYVPGARSKTWIKFKKGQFEKVIVTGFKPGELGPHSIIEAKDTHGVRVSVKALNNKWRAVFDAEGGDKFIGEELVISYQEKTSKGKYRSPMADHFVRFTF
jgi:ATP-dependent DNA ligase